jgi:hypothetical protein
MARVAAMRLLHGPAESVFVLGDENEMNVVRHQAVRPDVNIESVTPFGQQGFVFQKIGSSKEGLLTTVSSLRDVMRDSGDDDSGHFRHVRSLFRNDRCRRRHVAYRA